MVPQQLLISVEGFEQKDHSLIGFYENATEYYDAAYDGMYFKPGINSLSLYSVYNGINYALNELPSIENHKSIPLNFEAVRGGIHTITANWLESFGDDIPVYLEDRKERVLYNLRYSNTYNFTATPGDDKSRFIIHFEYPSGMDNMIEYVRMYSWQKEIHVDIPFEGQGEIYVFDVMGRNITNANVISGHNIIPLYRETGHYIIKLVCNQGVISKKLHIQ